MDESFFFNWKGARVVESDAGKSGKMQ